MLVLVGRVAADFGMVILIWLVQLIIYPSFAYSAKDTFVTWHEKYTGLITWVVLPLMCAQLGLTVLAAFREQSWGTLTSLGLILFCWVVTFTLSVPAHSQLQTLGNEIETVRWLVLTNWLRTVSWSLVSLISIKQFWDFYSKINV